MRRYRYPGKKLIYMQKSFKYDFERVTFEQHAQLTVERRIE